jgi:hypothetical protein
MTHSCCPTFDGFITDEIIIIDSGDEPWPHHEYRIAIPPRIIRDTSGLTKPMHEHTCRSLSINFCPWCGAKL